MNTQVVGNSGGPYPTMRGAVDYTGAFITLDKAHSIIDRGAMFSLQQKIALPSSGSGPIYLAGLTSATNAVHFVNQSFIADQGGIEIRLFEGASITGGTPLVPKNRNRAYQGIIAPEFSIVSSPTIVDPGTEIALSGLPTSTSPVSTGRQDSSQDEWVLKPSTQYLLEILNLSAVTSKTVYSSFNFYEPNLLTGYE